MIPIEVVFAKQTLEAGDAGYGALLASWGAGMVAGSLPSPRCAGAAARAARGLDARDRRRLPGDLGLADTRLACAASVIGGLGNGVQWIALVTAVQELTRAPTGGVLALLEALASAMPGAGFLLGGAIAALFEPRAATPSPGPE